MQVTLKIYIPVQNIILKKKDILKLFYTYFFSYTKLYLLIILATLM